MHTPFDCMNMKHFLIEKVLKSWIIINRRICSNSALVFKSHGIISMWINFQLHKLSFNSSSYANISQVAELFLMRCFSLRKCKCTNHVVDRSRISNSIFIQNLHFTVSDWENLWISFSYLLSMVIFIQKLKKSH